MLFFAIGCTVDRSGFDPIDDCIPLTCDQAGQRCGLLSDGCGGTEDCGPCDECIPDTCETLGAECGSIGDGCNRPLDCGTCSEPEACLGNLCICQRTTCQDLSAECGTIDDGCGNQVQCGTCSDQERCNQAHVCECIPKDCDELGAQCGPIDDGCGRTLNCGGCDGDEVCLAGNVCGCEKATCQSVNPQSCGLSWSDCSQSVVGCGIICEDSQTCVGDRCQVIATNGIVINEFSTRYHFVEILGRPNFDLKDLFVIGIEGDQEGNPGRIQVVVQLGAASGQPAMTLDEDGYRTYNLPVQGIAGGTMTLLLVRKFTFGGIGPQDVDSNNDGIRDLTPFEFQLDEVAVNDGGPGDRTYAANAVLRNDLGGQNQVVLGASRIPNGVDTHTPSDWKRNADNGFGIVPDAPIPEPGLAINTPHGGTVYDLPGYNVVIPPRENP